ncbi:translocation/assembly module TamB domain-containing protein [Marinobacterium aestuariivivens]|uniref:Translocation/assembly module TamB domain-containing protein n=1 Tax=Marinobacterium aestuariivivens TaxID=1698799 RepID=A0ABW2A1K0_9GAMM
MTASELQLGARSIDLVRLQGGGAQQDHALDLAVDAEDGSLALRLEGGLFDEQWRGRLTRLDLQQHLAGRWQLAAPVALELAADRARSEPLCLQAQDAEGRLCAEGQWLAAGDSNGDLELQRLPLSLLAPWLPAGAEVTGYLNGDARARLGASGSLDYDAVLSLDQTRLALPDEGLDFDLNRALASLEGSEERVSLTLDMTMDEIDGRLNAAVAVADPAGAGKLDGRVEMAMEDLRFLSVLVPAMKVDSGRLNGDFNIAGDLQQPAYAGPWN